MPVRHCLLAAVLGGLMVMPAEAQDAGAAAAAAPSAEALAKATQNPVASLISVPFQANWDMGIGDREATGMLLNVQPVMPFGISKSTNLILRVIMPVMTQPGPTAESPRISGMGDVVLSAFFSPQKVGKVIWGVGPVLLLPTATNNLIGTEKFGVGPTAVALVQPGKWTIGGLVNHIVSTSGARDRRDVNATLLQPFANYNLGGGLAVGVSAEASANWEAEETWTTPVLFNVAKVTMLGKRPMSFSVAAGPTFGPDAGANWRFRFVATLLFPR